MRHKLLGFLCLLIILLFVSSSYATTFNFNTGTGSNQGWTYDVVRSSDVITVQAQAPALFADDVNHPLLSGDSIDGNGSLMSNVNPSWSVANGDFAVIRWLSPVLSSDAQWQGASGFNAQVADRVTDAVTFTNLWMVIEDQDGNDRFFFNGIAQSNTQNAWTEHEFSNLHGVLAEADPCIESAILKYIMVFAWVEWPPAGVEGAIYLDEIVPTAGDGAGSWVGPCHVPEPGTMLLLGTGLLGLVGFRRKFKK